MTNNFHNMSTCEIVDEYGELNLQMKAIEARLKDLKEELKDRKIEKAEGNNFSLTITEQISGRMDTKAVKEYLGEEIAQKFEMIVVSSVVRVKNALPSIKLFRAA